MAVIKRQWRAGLVIIAAALMFGANAALAATDPGCTALGGDDTTGTCVVPAGTHVVGGAILVAEPLHLLAGAILDATASGVSLTVDPGSFEMDAGSSIRANGDNITITVPNGDMTMHGTPGTDKCGYVSPSTGLYTPHFAEGAVIISRPATLATTITIDIGNYPNIPPEGSFVMERCSLVDVSSGGSAGTVNITAGRDADIDGLVLSESTLSGTGSSQAPGGGPITIKTGCALIVTPTGVVSSKGNDPGADLVHLESCDVTIEGLVQSTGPGHAVPDNPANHCATDGPNGDHSAKPANSTACVEIIGKTIVITITGEVNADVNSTGAGGPEGESWIDLFSFEDITITGRTGVNDIFSVHANSLSGTDTTPNTITIKAGQDPNALATFTGTGRIISASAEGNGSFGGAVVVEASGAVILDTSTIKAAGDNIGGLAPCDSGPGACGRGGTIDVRSFNDLITWQNGVGNVNPDEGPAPPAGAISLTACTTVNTTGTNFDDAVPTVRATIYTDSAGVAHVLNNQLCGGLPIMPDYVLAAFVVGQPIWEACGAFTARKSGMKFNDLDDSKSFTAGDTPIANWPINLLTTANVLVATTNTLADGTYSFTFTAAGTFRVCEGTGPAGFVQTYPNALTPSPNAQGETIINTCPGPNIWGYEFTIVNGSNLVDNDFGNFKPQDCQKQTVLDVMAATYPGNLGADTTVHTNLGESVQTAVDNASDTNHDGYIIVMVIAHADGSLGGSANQNVVVWKDYGNLQPFALFGCSVTLTGGGAGPAVWVQSSANSKNIVVNGRTTDIFVMDLHGGNSAVGVQVEGAYRYLRNEGAGGNGIGIKVTDNYNTVHNGSASGNTGVGLKIDGSFNYVTDTDAFGNSSHGVQVTGNRNQLLKIDTGDKGKGNGGDGLKVTGNSNTIKEVDAYANGLNGFEVSGTGNSLSKNVAGDRGDKANGGVGFLLSGGSSLVENKAIGNLAEGFKLLTSGFSLKNNVSGGTGSGYPNAFCQYRFVVAGNTNAGGNKSNGVTLVGSPFPASCKN